VTTSPIILLGTQRSGTTLLCKILNSHPKIFIQNEFNVHDVFENTDACDIETKIKRQIEIEQGKSVDEILKQDNKWFWGIKDPSLTYHLEGLTKAFPESKFIIVVRDGRGVVNSYIKNKWGLGTNAYSGAQRWEKEINIQNEYIKSNSHLCLKVNYESLVNNAQATLREICAFLEIEFSEEMLSFHAKKANFSPNKQNENTNRELDVNIMEKWRDELSIRQIEVVEAVAGKILIQESYELSRPQVSIGSFEKKYYIWHQKIVGEIQLQYQLKRFAFKMFLKKNFGFYKK
jgi:hypothetical protein